jgi:flagellar biosynthesis protein FlhB
MSLFIAYCAASIFAFTGITSFYTSQTLKSTEFLVFIWKTVLNFVSNETALTLVTILQGIAQNGIFASAKSLDLKLSVASV